MLEVMSALDSYWNALEESNLSDASKGIYMSQADNFVRWMRGEFIPGSRNGNPFHSNSYADGKNVQRPG